MSSPDPAACVQAVTQLRKWALKKVDFSECAPELLRLFQTADRDLRILILKMAENILKGRSGTDINDEEPMFRLQRALQLQGLKDPLARIRKEAIYGLKATLRHFDQTGGSTWLHEPSLLTEVAPLIADTGCDLDLNNCNHPLTPKGTLTIAEAADDVIGCFPKKTDFTPVFYATVDALERLHVYMQNALLDPAYGQKLVECVLEVFRMLIGPKQSPLPVSRYPDVYPSFLAELICFTNDPKYKCISDHAIRMLLQPLIQSTRHTGALVAALEIEDYPEVKASVLRLLAEKLERGESLDWCLSRIQTTIERGNLEGVDLPESFQVWLNHRPGAS